jgi:hypothetical protein
MSVQTKARLREAANENMAILDSAPVKFMAYF